MQRIKFTVPVGSLVIRWKLKRLSCAYRPLRCPTQLSGWMENTAKGEPLWGNALTW